MAPKTVYLACAADDGPYRELFRTQWSRAGAQARFLDPPADRTTPAVWKTDVRARIRRSDAVIALITAGTPASAEQQWQIRCARAEGKPLLGLWLESGHRVKPAELGPARCENWSWETIGDFLDTL